MRKDIFIISLFMVMLLASCKSERQEEALLRQGDLAFVVADDTEFSQAIASATGKSAELCFDHVGVVAISDNGSVEIIEAIPQHGVCAVAWEQFKDSAPKRDGKPAIVVMRVTAPFDADKAVNNCRLRIGKPYDWAFAAGNDSIYCSELVQECYLDSAGSAIFESIPMNFLDSEGILSDFWAKNFEKLGIDVPQGQPGTNPNDMGRSQKLEEVIRLF